MHTQALGGIHGDLADLINVEQEDGQVISKLLYSYFNYALHRVNMERAYLGAVQNALEHTIRSLGVSSENLQDSESRIRNADMAREMKQFTLHGILQQASMAMLAQANNASNAVLQLIR